MTEDERLDRIVAALPPISEKHRAQIVEILRPFASHHAADAA
jgi:hypothetical protein